jgi:hypothetical protein
VVAYAKADDIDLKSKGAYGIGDFVDKFDDMEAGDFKTKPGPDKWDFNKKIRLHFMLVFSISFTVVVTVQDLHFPLGFPRCFEEGDARRAFLRYHHHEAVEAQAVCFRREGPAGRDGC